MRTHNWERDWCCLFEKLRMWSARSLISTVLVSTSIDHPLSGQYYTDQHIHWSPISWSVELAATCNYHLTGQTGRWSLLLPGIVFLSFCVLSFCLNSYNHELRPFRILNSYLYLCFVVVINTDQWPDIERWSLPPSPSMKRLFAFCPRTPFAAVRSKYCCSTRWQQ